MYIKKDPEMYKKQIKHDYLRDNLDDEIGPPNTTFEDMATLHLRQVLIILN